MDITCCLTTYPRRARFVPFVLDSLRKQTCPPRRYVITLARQDYALQNAFVGMPDVDVLIVEEDTKVWKKFLHAMLRMGDRDLVLTVDDDMLYPEDMVAEFADAHEYMPDAPISGNAYWHNGLKCHCGCASLVQPVHFAGWQQYKRYFYLMPSSDMFYTMLAANNHYAYMQTETDWMKAAQSLDTGTAYTRKGMVQDTYRTAAGLLGWLK